MNDQDHSQYGEAARLIQHFQDNPPKHWFLVDVGAFGIDISNTFDLISKHGWGGLLIEALPQEEFFRPLVDACQGKPVAIIEGLAIGDYEGFGTAFINKIPGQRSLLQALEHDGTVQVPVRPLAPVLQERGVPLDFDLLSVDAEGFDQRILKCLLVHSAYRPRVIIFEKDNHFAMLPPEEQHALWLERRGYQQLFNTEGNLAYVRLG